MCHSQGFVSASLQPGGILTFIGNLIESQKSPSLAPWPPHGHASPQCSQQVLTQQALWAQGLGPDSLARNDAIIQAWEKSK